MLDPISNVIPHVPRTQFMITSIMVLSIMTLSSPYLLLCRLIRSTVKVLYTNYSFTTAINNMLRQKLLKWHLHKQSSLTLLIVMDYTLTPNFYILTTLLLIYFVILANDSLFETSKFPITQHILMCQIGGYLLWLYLFYPILSHLTLLLTIIFVKKHSPSLLLLIILPVLRWRRRKNR